MKIPDLKDRALSIAGMTKEWLEGIVFPKRARREIFSHCSCWEVYDALGFSGVVPTFQ